MADPGADERVGAAAAAIAACRLAGQRLDPLPAARRPNDLAEAYLVQQQVAGRLAATHGPTVGWKIGCTTKVMQDYLQIPHPCGGRLYERGVQPSGVTLSIADYRRPAVELEIAVRLGVDLARRAEPYSAAECAGAVASWHASLEIVDDRYGPWTEVGTPTLVADDFFSSGCVYGAAVAGGDADMTIEAATLARDGVEIGGGRGDAILDHPINALVWLANGGAAPDGLKAGELVTLGSVVKTVWIEAPCAIEARFSTLGEVAVRFA